MIFLRRLQHKNNELWIGKKVGLGGYLMWTPLAREVNKMTGGAKVLPVETNGNFIKIIHSPIFENNPHMCQDFEEKSYLLPISFNNPSTNYCKSDTPEKAIQRHDKHIIHQICEHYGINNAELKCEIFLSEAEITNAANLLKDVDGDFITIDPHTKDEYTVNKRYPFQKWQNVVDKVRNNSEIKIIQIGNKTDQVLEGVIDFTGITTFRQAAAIISHAVLHVGPEGGLMHAANAVGTKSVILITGFLHPRMTCYKENSNIWIGKNHGPRGMKIECPKCKKEAEDHNELEIFEEIMRMLK